MDTKTDTKPSLRICPTYHTFGVHLGVHFPLETGSATLYHRVCRVALAHLRVLIVAALRTDELVGELDRNCGPQRVSTPRGSSDASISDFPTTFPYPCVCLVTS